MRFHRTLLWPLCILKTTSVSTWCSVLHGKTAGLSTLDIPSSVEKEKKKGHYDTILKHRTAYMVVETIALLCLFVMWSVV